MKCPNCPTNGLCKDCTKSYNAAYYRGHKKKLKKRAQNYRASHTEELKANRKQFRRNNKEKFRVRDREYYLANKESIQKRTTLYRIEHPEQARKYSQKGKRLLTSRFSRAQAQAARRKIPFALTIEEYLNAISKTCYYCNNKLGKPVQTSTGLDRLDNSKGYESSNVVSCCWSCNRVRHNVLTSEETKAVISLVLLLRTNRAGADSILERIVNLLEKA